MSLQEKVDLTLYTKSVEIERLVIGDVLGHDIFLKNGLLVAKAGVAINENHLRKLKNMSGQLVTIDLSKVFEKTMNASQSLMAKAAKGLDISKAETQAMIEPFVKEAKRERNAVKILHQLQSQDEYTFKHTVNVGIIAMFIGKWTGFSVNEIEDISLAGTLHDIGKSKVPLDILNKPGILTKDETVIIRKHSFWGYEILEKSGNYSEGVLMGVLQHHERDNGKGYPKGLKGKDIHPYAKIIAIADIYHAMTNDKVYKPKVNPFVALEYLRTNFFDLDNQMVFTFVDNMLDYLMGNKVCLSNGIIGNVIYIDKSNISCPVIQIEGSTEVIILGKNNEIKIEQIIEE